MALSRLPFVRMRSARQARVHAIILAVIMWLFAIAVGTIGKGDRGFAGPLKGADFVQFYTLGHLAHDHQIEAMYDMRALHDAQTALVPASGVDLYPAVYPPQVAAFFAPVSGWSYQRALLVWTLLSIVGYVLIVWSAWRPVSDVLSDRPLVIAAAAAFPPFWSLVLHGQITVLVLAAFWLGWLALERDQRLLAGVAFGLLAIKPQFGIPLAMVVLIGREWPMLAGALASVVAQVAAASWMLGLEAFRLFATETWSITFKNIDALESKPFLSHSLRTVTRLAPNWIGVPLWVALAAVVLWYTARVWRSDAPLRVRLGVVMLAAVLVNPHLIIYDATVLALPLLWFGAYMHERERRAAAAPFWITVYWLFAAFFAPTAAAIGVQVSVVLMVWLMVLVSRSVLRVVQQPRVITHAAA
jgi:alpha-1,2-mannosyltransferase